MSLTCNIGKQVHLVLLYFSLGANSGRYEDKQSLLKMFIRASGEEAIKSAGIHHELISVTLTYTYTYVWCMCRE